jgi:predicted RNase H-like HicB family nuclease
LRNISYLVIHGKWSPSSFAEAKLTLAHRLVIFNHEEQISEKQMKRTFTLEYWLDEGWYVGKLKEVPGVFSQGQTLDELEENIQDAYKLMMEDEVDEHVSVQKQTKELAVEV